MAKDRPQPESLVVSCEVVRDLPGDGSPGCPSCRAPLELHQPDLDQPNRLLGTCPGCGSWFVYDVPTRGRSALRIRIPGASELGGAGRGRARRGGAGPAAPADTIEG